MKRREEIARELARLGNVANALEARHKAHFDLHRAACLLADAKEIEQRRDELHTLLDVLLDNGEQIHRLIHELVNLP